MIESFEAFSHGIVLNGELHIPLSVFRMLEPEYQGLPTGYGRQHYIPGVSHTIRGEGILTNNLPTSWPSGDRYIARIEEFRRLINERNTEEAERKAVMEDIKFSKLNYREQRVAKYPPINDLVVALWEKIVEGRSEKCDEIQVLRSEIKSKYPKQEG